MKNDIIYCKSCKNEFSYDELKEKKPNFFRSLIQSPFQGRNSMNSEQIEIDRCPECENLEKDKENPKKDS